LDRLASSIAAIELCGRVEAEFKRRLAAGENLASTFQLREENDRGRTSAGTIFAGGGVVHNLTVSG
jgi:hypothetical protein